MLRKVFEEFPNLKLTEQVPGMPKLTVQLNINFISISNNTELFATAHVMCSGIHLIHIESELREASNKIIAKAQGVWMLFKQRT
jgi:acyl-coenzyme A thioesterase PaaI-like protein